MSNLGSSRRSFFSVNIGKEIIEELLERQLPIKYIARHLKISRPTLYKLMKKYGMENAFKLLTNEQILKSMKEIVTTVPEALFDAALMKKLLEDEQGRFVTSRRFNNCLRKIKAFCGHHDPFSG